MPRGNSPAGSAPVLRQTKAHYRKNVLSRAPRQRTTAPVEGYEQGCHGRERGAKGGPAEEMQDGMPCRSGAGGARRPVRSPNLDVPKLLAPH